MNDRRPRFFFITLLTLFSLAGAGTLSLIYFLYQSDGDSTETVNIVIPRGSSIKSVSNELHKKEVIGRPTVFKNILRFTGGATKLRAGEFRFKKHMRLIDALYVLYRDEPVVHQVTIPEGKTIRQIADILAGDNLVDPIRFTQLAYSQELLQRHKISGPSLEGYLFPDTYVFSLVDGEDRIIETMVKRFSQKFTKELEEEAKSKGWTVANLVVLASIVEKESGSPGERPMVASVFHNRLKRGMKLQSDPTTIYGIANFNGNLRKIDLITPTPYNTYTIKGLPPGPICNPGIDALTATLRPAQSDYLFFVSNNNGVHVFSETLAKHNAYVDQYQRNRSRQKKKK